MTCAPITGNEEVPFDREKEVVSVDMEALLDLTWVEYQDRLPNRMDQWGQRIQIDEMDTRAARRGNGLPHAFDKRPAR